MCFLYCSSDSFVLDGVFEREREREIAPVFKVVQPLAILLVRVNE